MKAYRYPLPLRRQPTVTEMHDNMNIDNTIAGSMNDRS